MCILQNKPYLKSVLDLYQFIIRNIFNMTVLRENSHNGYIQSPGIILIFIMLILMKRKRKPDKGEMRRFTFCSLVPNEIAFCLFIFCIPSGIVFLAKQLKEIISRKHNFFSRSIERWQNLTFRNLFFNIF